MKRNKIILISALVAIVFLVGFKLMSNKQTINQKAEAAIASQVFDVIPVKTALVKQEDISNRMVQSGTFAAQQDLKLAAQSQGQIKTLLVKKTQFITKGTLLATIDNSSLSSQLATSKATLEKAQQDAKRMSNALTTGGVTQQEVESAQLQVQNAQTQVTQLQQQMQNFQIIAPMDGVVNDIYAEAGSFVTPGTPVLEIVDITKLLLTVRINQNMLPDLKLGQKVNVTTDVYPNKIFEGKVATVNVKADASQKIEVGVSVVNSSDAPLLAGIYGHAEFLTDKKNESVMVLTIPRDAIIGSVQSANVFVVKDDNTVALKTIVTGKIIDNNVEVVSGLNVGEQVVTAGQINLEDGKKVIVKNK